MLRIPLLFALSLLLCALGALPTANAAPPCVAAPLDDKVDCVQDLVAGRCIYGYSPECVVYNPCDPTYCDPYWP